MFAGPGFWDRHNDPGLYELFAAGLDGARETLQRLDEHAYAAAVGPFPAFVMHAPTVAVDPRGRLGALGVTLSDLSWR
jgi:hypothetical protein